MFFAWMFLFGHSLGAIFKPPTKIQKDTDFPCILNKVGNFGGTENESDSYGGKSPFCGNFQLVSCW